MSLDFSQFYDWLKPLSKKDGIHFELYGSSTLNDSIGFTEKDKKASQSQSQHVNLRVSQGNKTGTSFTKNFSKNSLQDCYQKAKASLYFTDSENFGFLSENQNFIKQTPFYHPEIAQLSLEEKQKELEKLHQFCSRFDKKIKPVLVQLKSQEQSCFFLNSLASQSDFKNSNLFVICVLIGVDGDSRSQIYSYKSCKKLAQLEPEKLGQETGQLTLNKLHSQVPDTKKYPVIFQPKEAGMTLLSSFVGLMNAKSIFDKVSVLNPSSLNKACFSPQLSIYDDPLKASGFNSQSFDGEGFVSEKTPLIENGVLKNFLSSSFYSKKMKIPHTKKALWLEDQMLISSTNLVMNPGDSSFEELLCEFPQVIVIDTLKSMAGYNPASGDFSIEAEGFLYEGTKLLHPLSQFTVSGNILDLFSNILKIENQSHNYISVKAPAFLVPELSISGK